MLRAISGISSIREPERSLGDSGDPGPEDEVAALRERIAELLSPTPTPRDDLVRITGAPAAMVYAALTELALANRAELLPGGLAARA